MEEESGLLGQGETAEQQQPRMIMINVTHPSQTQDNRLRSTIRSQVTQQQHRRRRPIQASVVVEDASPGSNQSSVVASQLSWTSSANTAPGSSVRGDSSEEPSRFHFVSVNEPGGTADLQSRRRALAHVSSQQHRIRREQSEASPLPLSALALRAFPLEEQRDGLHLSLERTGLDLTGVLDHYSFVVRPQQPGLSQFFLENVTGLVNTFWIPFVLAEPASATAVIILAAFSKLAALDQPWTRVDTWPLQSFAINVVQQTLNDTRGATSDHTIVCVATLAFFEAIHGNLDGYQVHWQGLLSMIELRGGLDALGRNEMIKTAVVCFDAQCAMLTGGRPTFDFEIARREPLVAHADFERYSQGVIAKLKGEIREEA